jgi:RES domain-containing protein
MEIEAEDRPNSFRLIQIEGPEGLSMTTVMPEELPENWPDDSVATQRLGDRWLESRRSLLLKVPSVLIPETWNVVVNPLHPEAALLKISAGYEHAFDLRLFA